MNVPAVVEPSAALAVHDQCEEVERWAAECGSVSELRDAGNKLAAIDEYLQRTTTEGRARVAATMRRLEVRIGELLGPAKVGGDHGNQHTGGKTVTTDVALSADQRHDFRQMDAEFFFARLRDGQGLLEGDPIYAVRKAILNALAVPTGRRSVGDVWLMAILIKSWNAYRTGKQTKLLSWKAGGANPEAFPEPV